MLCTLLISIDPIKYKKALNLDVFSLFILFAGK